MFNSIIIGSGFAGSVVARVLAEQGKRVLIIEKRNHTGGNCYDEKDKYGILVHKYGPHIFHTNNREVYDFLSRFTKWYPYSHEVMGYINGEYMPVPFNLNTLEQVYGTEKAEKLKKILLEQYGENAKVPILELKHSDNEDIREIAKFVYDNIFLKYTIKQWGKKPEEVDASVTARVPVVLSYDNRYFQDEYQGMPMDGYAGIFEKMLDHENIEIKLNTDAKEILRTDENEQVKVEGKPFSGNVIYTGPIDELFDCCYGKLPYRSLKFVFEHYDKDYYQPKGVVNYTVSEDYTRITEFKYLTGQKIPGSTTIMKEYPLAYEGKDGQIPYYSIINEENLKLYGKYQQLAESIPNFYLLGRLAEYKYYNIDAIVEKALELGRNLK